MATGRGLGPSVESVLGEGVDPGSGRGEQGVGGVSVSRGEGRAACYSAGWCYSSRRRGKGGWSGFGGWDVSGLFNQEIPQLLQARPLQLD